jgi:hypothetical protein
METIDEAAAAIAQQMLENLRHNVAGDKRRRALLHGVTYSEGVDEFFEKAHETAQELDKQISRCCK